MEAVPTQVPATWQVQDPDRHRVTGLHFVRLTGPDGVPGLDGQSGVTVWTAPVTGGAPDMTGMTRVAPDGTDMVPKQGDWVLTRENGDLRLWPVGAGGTVAGTSQDLPDGPAGPPGDASTAKHTHIYAMATNSYQLVRDKYVGADVSTAATVEVR